LTAAAEIASPVCDAAAIKRLHALGASTTMAPMTSQSSPGDWASSRPLIKLLDRAEGDDRCRGVILTGSAARGVATEHSDLDVYVVLAEPVPGLETTRTPVIDTIYITLADLADVPADPGGWHDRWTFAYTRVLLDKGGVAEAAAAQATLSDDEVCACLDHYLDAYINYAYRSLKADREGRRFERRLDAADSVRCLLWCVFAFNGRVRPHNKYLRWELAHHPFDQPAWSELPLIDLLTAILDDGDPVAQRRIFAAVEHDARRHGFGGLVDEWGSELALLRGESVQRLPTTRDR
jgi:Nucleotidyltransferase domain